MKYFRRWTINKCYYLFWTLLFFSVIIYNEFVSYKIKRREWSEVVCHNVNECTKILLVADPQIIGLQNEIIHSLTPLSIIDSDWYLKKTYWHVFDFVRPDIVIFLGDLMDEAHIATDPEFSYYVQRIFNIFSDHSSVSSNVKHIWLPGDNDIGGEDTQVSPKKLQRFQRAFNQPSTINFKNNTFFKINRLTSILPVYKKERDFYNTGKIMVGLSHVPLMFRPSPFVDRVIEKMQPHVMFTAHEHKAMIINTDASHRQDYHITPVTENDNKVYEFTLGVTDMYEILVPTCSYRMGTNKIGYGYAVIENNQLKFTVLWSPPRFLQLCCYIILICVFIAMTTFIRCYFCFLKTRKKVRRILV